jgi:hypothetical protein
MVVPVVTNLSEEEPSPSVPAVVLTTQGWVLPELVETHKNFRHVSRLSASAVSHDIIQKMKDHESSTQPLVIEGYHELEGWPQDTFTPDWLTLYGKQQRTSTMLSQR